MILKSEEKQKSNESGAQDYIGNSKKITINENKDRIRIVGNGNKVFLATNSGTLEIIGNSTIVRVMCNQGNIEYTGNNGKIYLCHDSSTKSVKYTGSNGTIKLVPKDELLVKKSTPVISPLRENHFSHNNDLSELFDGKFKQFTDNSFFGTNNLSMPNVGSIQSNVNVIQVAPSNIVIDRNL